MTQPQEQQRTPPAEPPRPVKPVANANEYRARLVPLQHNFGDPIHYVARPTKEEARAMRKAIKKGRRKQVQAEPAHTAVPAPHFLKGK